MKKIISDIAVAISFSLLVYLFTKWLESLMSVGYKDMIFNPDWWIWLCAWLGVLLLILVGKLSLPVSEDGLARFIPSLAGKRYQSNDPKIVYSAVSESFAVEKLFVPYLFFVVSGMFFTTFLHCEYGGLFLVAYVFLSIGGAFTYIHRCRTVAKFSRVPLELKSEVTTVGDTFLAKVAMPFEHNFDDVFSAKLQCYYTDTSYVDVNNIQESKSEEVWSASKAAYIKPYAEGVELYIAIDIPEHLPATDEGIYDWTLTLRSYGSKPEMDQEYVVQIVGQTEGKKEE